MRALAIAFEISLQSRRRGGASLGPGPLVGMPDFHRFALTLGGSLDIGSAPRGRLVTRVLIHGAQSL